MFIYLEVFVSSSFYMFKKIAKVDNDVQMLEGMVEVLVKQDL